MGARIIERKRSEGSKEQLKRAMVFRRPLALSGTEKELCLHNRTQPHLGRAGGVQSRNDSRRRVI
ncbi:MAG TPA: hypothetical protein VEK15_14745, partial [Vicinamibacteria bacterium]|nr:hypothetical protein [Vicinamibacteria bacterium]